MTPQMTIGGAAVGADAEFPVIDPATGEPFATAPDCTPDQLDDAVTAAVNAGSSWRTDGAARSRALHALADLLDEHADELSRLLTAEQGKPLGASGFEVTETARWLRASAELPLTTQVLASDERSRVELRHRPLGVVAAITPWNYPLLLAGWKLGPALRAGNTVVLKPSPYTPLTTLRLGELTREVLPPGVVNVVTGGDALGARLTGHPAVAKISFTGSVATGKAVAGAAAADLKRLTLELGGNDAAIVLDDVDVAAVAKGVFWGGFINCGQICAGVKRVYVPRRLHGELVDALATRARAARVGPGTEPGVQIGPLQNLPQYQRVRELVAQAQAAGAKAAAGGASLDRAGYFLAPTILTDVAEGMRVVDEEQFGPVLPVLPYDSVDEAVARANATPFGLSGSVWGTDLDRAAAVAERLDCGTAFVNDHLTLAPDVPFGGWKHSGVGVENGPWGLAEFTQLQVLRR